MDKKELEQSVFEELNAIDCNSHTEKKNGLTYLSWAWAWTEIKKHFPDAYYTIYENKDGLFYHTDGNTCWVKTGVTIHDIEHIEYLPVMDYRNQSIPVSKVTSFDVNKAIQRSLTKACARHGLGLYIYAGEDLPENIEKQEAHPQKDNAVITPKKEEKAAAENKSILTEEEMCKVVMAQETYAEAIAKAKSFGADSTKEPWTTLLKDVKKKFGK